MIQPKQEYKTYFMMVKDLLKLDPQKGFESRGLKKLVLGDLPDSNQIS